MNVSVIFQGQEAEVTPEGLIVLPLGTDPREPVDDEIQLVADVLQSSNAATEAVGARADLLAALEAVRLVNAPEVIDPTAAAAVAPALRAAFEEFRDKEDPTSEQVALLVLANALEAVFKLLLAASQGSETVSLALMDHESRIQGLGG